jgi:hypothetical protein
LRGVEGDCWHGPRRSNGLELTGADPHAEKYSARAATSGAASGAAWSWAALVTIDRAAGMPPQATSQVLAIFETWALTSQTIADERRERACHLRCANPPTSPRARGTNRQRSPESEHALKVAGASETPTPNGPELTGADPHAEKYSPPEVAASGAASGAAWSWAAVRVALLAERRTWTNWGLNSSPTSP